MDSPVHESVLAAANRIAALGDGTFTPDDVVRALPNLNENTVRTHIVSRCCVGAPKHHGTVWPYFRRIGRGKYRIEPKYRATAPVGRGSQTEGWQSDKGGGAGRGDGSKRDTIHAVLQKGEFAYIAECLEVAVVTQGNTLDEVVQNLQEALALHLEGEDMALFGLANEPRLQLIYDLALAS